MASRIPLLVASLILGACCASGDLPIGDAGKEVNLEELAEILEDKLDGNCVGYAFVISYKDKVGAMRAGGECRRDQDPPSRDMSVFEKFNIASVSKTITAAALLHVLDAKGVSLDSAFYMYLPSHWEVASSLKSITFRHLITHTSGIAFDKEVFYQELKKYVAAGGLGKKVYNNANFALMRFLIPKLAGYDILQLGNNPSETTLKLVEAAQEQQYAVAYMDYVQKNVFDKAGGALKSMECKPTDEKPALSYQFPKTDANGTDWGENTTINASRGWNMSAVQLSLFFRTLHYTEKILPKSRTDQMKNEKLGYEWTGTNGVGVAMYFHKGWYPGGNNPGELNAAIVGYGNDVQIAIIINSQVDYSNGFLQAVNDSFEEWYK